MKRLYTDLIQDHLDHHNQMVFLSGPRQVGKTTIAKTFNNTNYNFTYLNWDDDQDRQIILNGSSAITDKMALHTLQQTPPLLVLDEIHKHADWKNSLKGLYDKYNDQLKIIVTGSARLDIYKKGGDSMMGRYFPYRIHPCSTAELLQCQFEETLIRPPQKIADDLFGALLEFGGFPAPLIQQNKRFHQRWQRLRLQQLVREDIRDLSHIQDLSKIELLTQQLNHHASQLITYSNLAKHLRTSIDTIKNWLNTLNNFYYCFQIQPWSTNVTRSLLKQPKTYLWDWSTITDKGARHENFIAAHLLKAIHFWVDSGLGHFDLHYVRDKDKREVDFLISRDNKPWILIEAKSADNKQLSPALKHFHQQLKTEHAFQVVIDMPYVDADCFATNQPIIVPAKTLLSQLI